MSMWSISSELWSRTYPDEPAASVGDIRLENPLAPCESVERSLDVSGFYECGQQIECKRVVAYANWPVTQLGRWAVGGCRCVLKSASVGVSTYLVGNV